MGDFLGNLFGGIKNVFSGATQGAGNLLGGIGSLFSGRGQSSQQPSYVNRAMTNPTNIAHFQQSNQMPSFPQMNIGGMKSGSMGKQKTIMDSLFPGGSTAGIAGLAAPAIGNMFAPKSPNIPDINSLSSVQAMQNFKPGNSVSPEYQTMIQNNVNQLRDQQIRELQATYHNARPGTDYTTDSNYQRDLALLNQNVQNNMTDELAKAEGTFSSQEQQRLSEIAQMDIYSIMAQTGMKAQEAQQFKEMFSNIGNTFLTSATHDNSFEDAMKQFYLKQATK